MKVRLGDLTVIRTGKLDANAASENGQYPFFTCSREPLSISTYSYDCECVLVAGNGDLNVKYYNGKFDAYQRTYIIQDNGEGKLYIPYLYYFLEGYIEELRKQAIGGVIKYIKLGNLTEAVIELPTLDRQKEIVSNLEKSKQILDARQQQLVVLNTLIKARFVELTKSHGTVSTRMGDIATFLNGYAFKPEQWETTGFPIIRIQNLNDKNAPYNYFSGVLADKYFVRNGDVLVSWATHLEAYIWNGDNAWLNQHIFKVVFDKMDVDKTYFVYATEEALRQAFRNAHGFKPTMEHIKKADFDNAIVELPDLAVQQEFAAFVAQIDKSKVVVQKALDEAQILFDSLMQQYFG